MTSDQHLELNLRHLNRLIEWTNRDASVICHPDDEVIVREGLAQIPENLRPQVVVSASVPHPGTAFFSRPMPLTEITGPYPLEVSAADAAESMLDDRTPIRLPDGRLLSGEAAAAYRQTSRRIAARLAAREAILRKESVNLIDFLNEPTKGNQ